MAKLFYASGACSMSCHIGLEEAGLKYTTAEIEFEKEDANAAELKKLNPLGAVPVFISDQGKVLTQNAAILEYIADSQPSSHLLPEKGTWERAEALSWLSFASSDLHKAFGPLFRIDAIVNNPEARAELRSFATKNVNDYLAHLDHHLEGKDYIMGKQFTAPDAYIFTVVGWCKWLKIPIEGYKNLSAYMSRVYQRPAVQRVLKAEDLLE